MSETIPKVDNLIYIKILDKVKVTSIYIVHLTGHVTS